MSGGASGENRPVRIAVDVREWRTGTSTGIARVVSGFLRWAAANTEHTFLLVGNQHTEFRVDGMRVEHIRIPEGNRLTWDQKALPRILSERAAAVFLSPYYKAPLRAPCPVVVIASDLIELHFPRGGVARRAILPLWMGVMLRGAARILTLSEYSRRDIVEKLGIAPGQVSVFPPAVDERFDTPATRQDTGRVRARYRLPEDYVVYVGRCAPHKNVDTLLAAWRRLSDALRRRFALVLAGGDAALFAAAAERAGVALAIPGFVDDADMPALYAGAALMCYPSSYEGFGLPPLEAMACGTAVVAADATSIPEVVGDAALLVDPSDAQAWSAALANLLVDDRARAELAERGAAHARRYTLERSATAVLECLVGVTVGRPA